MKPEHAIWLNITDLPYYYGMFKNSVFFPYTMWPAYGELFQKTNWWVGRVIDIYSETQYIGWAYPKEAETILDAYLDNDQYDPDIWYRYVYNDLAFYQFWQLFWMFFTHWGVIDDDEWFQFIQNTRNGWFAIDVPSPNRYPFGNFLKMPTEQIKRQHLCFLYPLSLYSEIRDPFASIDPWGEVKFIKSVEIWEAASRLKYPHFDVAKHALTYADARSQMHHDYATGQYITDSLSWGHPVVNRGLDHRLPGLFFYWHEFYGLFDTWIPGFHTYNNQLVIPMWWSELFVAYNDSIITSIFPSYGPFWTKEHIQWFHTLNHLEDLLWNDKVYKNTGHFSDEFNSVRFNGKAVLPPEVVQQFNLVGPKSLQEQLEFEDQNTKGIMETFWTTYETLKSKFTEGETINDISNVEEEKKIIYSADGMPLMEEWNYPEEILTKTEEQIRRELEQKAEYEALDELVKKLELDEKKREFYQYIKKGGFVYNN